MIDKRFIVGYGTGRCGTKSLAQFLDQQDGFSVTHEGTSFGWVPAFSDIDMGLREFAARCGDVIGDIGFYWVHYVGVLFRTRQNVKAINLYRPDDEVIESFWAYKKLGKDVYDYGGWKGYPFDSPDMTKDAIAMTVKKYRMYECELRKIFPHLIYTMAMEQLNDTNKLEELLEWLGSDGRKVLRLVHTNTREEILSKNALNKRPIMGRSRRVK